METWSTLGVHEFVHLLKLMLSGNGDNLFLTQHLSNLGTPKKGFKNVFHCKLSKIEDDQQFQRFQSDFSSSQDIAQNPLIPECFKHVVDGGELSETATDIIVEVLRMCAPDISMYQPVIHVTWHPSGTLPVTKDAGGWRWARVVDVFGNPTSWAQPLGPKWAQSEVIMSQLGGLRAKPLGNELFHGTGGIRRNQALRHSWAVSRIFLPSNFKGLSQFEMFKSFKSRVFRDFEQRGLKHFWVVESRLLWKATLATSARWPLLAMEN